MWSHSKNPSYLLWRQCTSSMPPPFLSARTPIWGLNRKNVQHLPNRAKLPVFWKGVGVLFHMSVKLAEVNAKLQAAILLPYQYHCIAPHTLARPDSARLQHLPQVVPNLLNQQQGDLPESLFKGSVICNFYCVFGGMGTAHFHGSQWKHVMVLSQELEDSIHQLWRPRI